MRTNRSGRIFNITNYTFLGLIGFICLYPLWYVLIASISSPDAVNVGDVIFLPKDITFNSYKEVLSTGGIWVAYGNTIFYAVVGTALSVIITICGAYPLSKRRLFGRRFLSFLTMFTMWFYAGIIPFYLNMKSLNLLNSRFGIIIAFACQAFYVILLRTYFESIPESLEESAKIDGANDIRVLINIILPISKPAIATIILYYCIQRWNGYFWSMLLLTDEKKIPLQVLLKKIVVEMQVSENLLDVVDVGLMSKETIIYSTIVISIIPVIFIYLSIQKFLIEGIMIGAVKG